MIEISLVLRRSFDFPVARCQDCTVEEENFGEPFDARFKRLCVRNACSFVAILLILFLVSSLDEIIYFESEVAETSKEFEA